MSRRIDRRVQDTAPVRDEAVRGLSLDGEAELLGTIMAEQHGGAPDVPAAPTPPRRRTTRSRRIGLTLAATAAVGLFALAGVSLTGGGSGGQTVWASSALRVADAVPRLLIGDDWKVTRADQFQVDDGEMTFEHGDLRADLTWRAAATHADYVADRAHESTRLPDVAVTGVPATVFKYRTPGAYDDYTALWKSGRYSLELRMGGERLPRERFLTVLRSLRIVDVDAWLSAMPASVVKPADRDDAVRGMLAGIPLPDGFDAGKLDDGDGVNDRYQLGATVAGAVACEWIERWATARADGDAAGERAAADALATSRRWPILKEMDAAGAYPEVLWDFADAVNGSGRAMGGKGMPVEVAAVEGLGCDAIAVAEPTGGERADLVEEALSGVPLPDGFDAGVVTAREDLRGPYELQRGAVDAVACAWIERWIDARRAGDGAAARAAADALASAGGWPIVRAIPSGGDFPYTLLEFAEGIRGDGRVHDGTRPVEDVYSSAFGCSGF